MEIVDWEKLFAPHILSRGEEYYESELVEIEAMDSWHAGYPNQIRQQVFPEVAGDAAD